jgi:hypothetical protein
MSPFYAKSGGCVKRFPRLHRSPGAGCRNWPTAVLRIRKDWLEFTMATKHQDGSLLEAKRTQLAPPPLYKVLLLNDDFTPMDFVIVVLQKFFGDGSRTSDANHAQSSHRRAGCLWGLPARRRGHQS